MYHTNNQLFYFPCQNLKSQNKLLLLYILNFLSKLPGELKRLIMKKILLLFAIIGLLFACSKDDDNEELTSLEVLQQAITATDQEAATKLFEGVWVDESEKERITITIGQYIKESNINWTPDTSINIKPLWIKTNNIYQLIYIKDISLFESYAYSFEKINENQFFYRGSIYMYLGPNPSEDIRDFFGYTHPEAYIEYTKVK